MLNAILPYSIIERNSQYFKRDDAIFAKEITEIGAFFLRHFFRKIQLIKDEKKKFEILNLTQSLDTHHYNQRSMVERVNKYLKEDFGCSNIYYKGATKVASVLAFGILCVCIHQSLKLVI